MLDFKGNEREMKLKELKKGTFFTKKQINYPYEDQVWVRGDYDRSEKRYECHRFSDVNDTQWIKGDREVFTGFTF